MTKAQFMIILSGILDRVVKNFAQKVFFLVIFCLDSHQDRIDMVRELMIRKHRFKIDKLVRDKLPDIMQEAKITVVKRVMEHDEYIKRLKDKLLEEAQEVVQANNQIALKEELADLLEVIHALSLAHGFSYQACEEIRLKKKSKKGGFEKRIYNAYIDISSDNQKILYYQAQSDKYPEINSD